MQKWQCFIPGRPVARAEKLVTIRAKGGKVFNRLADRPDQASYKSYVREFIARHRPPQLMNGPMSLVIWVYRERPKSAPARVVIPTTRPDWTNYAKLAEDCLTGLIIVDDALVVSAKVEKRFATIKQPPGIFIEICRVDHVRSNHEGFELVRCGG